MQAVDQEQLRQRVLRELRALSTADDFMDDAAAAALQIHTTDMHAGEVLDREGPMTIGELARSVGLSPGAATALVDRLEQAGLATRRQDPTNRRRVLVQPSQEASGIAYAVFGPLIARMAELLGSYSEQELELIGEFLHRARTVVAERARELRSRP